MNTFVSELSFMNYYYITGTSRGIGKAIAEELLKDDNNHVTGISRGNSIQHSRFHHIPLDLSNTTAVQLFVFPQHQNTRRIVLINNAGTMSDVKYLGKLNADDIVRDYHINLVSPTILMNSFISAYQNEDADKIIINISSGAGKRPIDGWGVYCSSKAGLDMVSQVAADEQKKNGEGFRILSVAPGIVDTQMQTDIRKAKEHSFSRIEEFIDYKKSGKLADPAVVALKYVDLINNLHAISHVVISVNDI